MWIGIKGDSSILVVCDEETFVMVKGTSDVLPMTSVRVVHSAAEVIELLIARCDSATVAQATIFQSEQQE